MTALFRIAAYEPRGHRGQRGWRIILPVWVPRYERYYHIGNDEFRFGVRIDTIAISFVHDRYGVRVGLDWGPVELGEWVPIVAPSRCIPPVPWMGL